MTLRPIESKDLAEIITLRTLTRENVFSLEDLRRLGITEESTAALLGSSHRGWLCEIGGKIVGFAIGNGMTAELWVIAVLPDFEGRGIGSQLLETVETWLWSRGFDELWLWTSSDRSKSAFTFYLKRGWLISDTKDKTVYMKKRRPGLFGLHSGNKLINL
jgi:GNAT superfamily N-acetyltransferase